ncbi:MAG TPA: hypothetical protein VJU86_07450 [Pyrinomonadaceae bacterium]|nr:hypothetical protein [Pyrinomonadaceae bacterium]
MRGILLTASLVLAFSLISCSRSSTERTNEATPTPTAKPKNVEIADSETEFQLTVDESSRAEVRQAVADTLGSKLPAWSLKGMASEAYVNGVFWVSADIEKDGRNVVLNLVVQKYFPESGAPYWKVLIANRTLKQRLHYMSDAETWKKLNEVTSELDETKNELENLKNPVEDDREPADPY